MPAVYVCPLVQVPSAVQKLNPSHLITLLDPKDIIPTPEGIHPDFHLRVGINDIVETLPGQIAPETHHVERVIDFIHTWQGDRPLLVHCWAGISRSTATAFIALCMRNPDVPEIVIAKAMRAQAAHVHPNKRIIGFADQLLKRGGRMVDAVERLGPGRIVYEGKLFGLPMKFDAANHG